jgi:hypothetical protein
MVLFLNKRYQIFISSTFKDLIEERQAVLKAILEVDHMPAGMELFPASDDTAWQLIKDVIDASDYYVLIIGGRYGSLDETGISYTQKEYEYALQTKKPVIPLLHKNPDNLPRDKTEIDQFAWKKLTDFRKLVELNHTCVYWNSSEDLKSKVIVGLTSIQKRNPSIGWVRADQVPTGSTLQDILKLKDRVAELEGELQRTKTQPPAGIEDLKQGEDVYEIDISFHARPVGGHYSDEIRYKGTITPTWNELFGGIAPIMINEASDLSLKKAFKDFIFRYANNEFSDSEQFVDYRLNSFSLVTMSLLDTCIVQFRALGLISESQKKRSIKDTGTYWSLTPYGDNLMVQLRAIRKKALEHKRSAGEAMKDDSIET